MGANGNRRQTLRNNIIQPYEAGLLTETDHKDYNAVVGIELDKVSTATKHMFQGLDDVRKEVNARTKALDALHLTVNDQFNRVMLEIGGVKQQIGQGITMDSITDADGNVLSGVLQGLKTEVNAANGNVMVALGEITNLGTRFDGEILTVKSSVKINSDAIIKTNGDVTAANGRIDTLTNTTIPAIVTKIDSEVQRIDGVITTTKDGLTQQIAKSETDLRQEISTTAGTINNSLSNTNQLVTTINRDGTAAYKAQWELKTDVNGLQRGVGFVNDGSTGKFTVNADVFQFTGGGSGNSTLPFYIDGTGTHIKQASIGNVTIDGAKITGTIQSDNYNPGANTGWQINKSGTINLYSGTISIIGGNPGAGRLVITNNQILVYDDANRLRVKLGQL